MRDPRNAWFSLTRKYEDVESVYRELEERHRVRWRRYHTLTHVMALLSLYADYRSNVGAVDDPIAFELAIWFHDAVYVPGASDNEERSADLATRRCRRMGVAIETVQSVADLIMATKHTGGESSHPDAALIQDVDLAILGSDPARFRAYDSAIRTEYAHVAEQRYRLGRSTLLQGFLRRRSIYRTDWARRRFERTARANLTAALGELRRFDVH
jgi:predicted metal-dependent HD superfamily phosphohydrolase